MQNVSKRCSAVCGLRCHSIIKMFYFTDKGGPHERIVEIVLVVF